MPIEIGVPAPKLTPAEGRSILEAAQALLRQDGSIEGNGGPLPDLVEQAEEAFPEGSSGHGLCSLVAWALLIICCDDKCDNPADTEDLIAALEVLKGQLPVA